LTDYLDARAVALVTNATVALEMAFLESIDDGEVIVPAFSFPATWNLFFENPRFKVVFADIGPDFCLDPDAVEAAITDRTTAIVGVHTYGFLCDHTRLRALCDRHGLRLIYDAAHAFGVRTPGQPCSRLGDLNVYSFHATKVYNTLEGGAITGDASWIDRLKRRRNFGLSREEQFCFGTNGKMDELRAAIGLLNLRGLDAAIAARARVARYYLHVLPRETGLLQVFPDLIFPKVGAHNHAYFPVRVHPDAPVDRDGLLEALRQEGILARRYFYPTPTSSTLYRDHVTDGALPVTRRCSLDTICLPIHHRMSKADCEHVVGSLVRALCS
ncbi:MAG: aminotransferase, partial [Deltaproteobacteria bacterium]|nr:aminotransferase [Deltaproteobacteria bacterium]